MLVIHLFHSLQATLCLCNKSQNWSIAVYGRQIATLKNTTSNSIYCRQQIRKLRKLFTHRWQQNLWIWAHIYLLLSCCFLFQIFSFIHKNLSFPSGIFWILTGVFFYLPSGNFWIQYQARSFPTDASLPVLQDKLHLELHLHDLLILYLWPSHLLQF